VGRAEELWFVEIKNDDTGVWFVKVSLVDDLWFAEVEIDDVSWFVEFGEVDNVLWFVEMEEFEALLPAVVEIIDEMWFVEVKGDDLKFVGVGEVGEVNEFLFKEVRNFRAKCFAELEVDDFWSVEVVEIFVEVEEVDDLWLVKLFWHLDDLTVWWRSDWVFMSSTL